MFEIFMEGHHHQQYHPQYHPLHHLHHRQLQQQHQQQQHSIVSSPVSVSAAVDVSGGDRFPQWSIQETKEFLVIRAELDQAFMETKRNKQLWEVISNRMKEKGYLRSPEQCKCKWKNLVTRYKGCETMEPEALRQQFPFYNELQMIFTTRMQRMLWAEAAPAEGASGGGSSKKMAPQSLSSEDEDEEYEDDNKNREEDSDQGDHHLQKGTTTTSSSRKAAAVKAKKKKGKGGSGNYGMNESLKTMKEILGEFMRKQVEMEGKWMEAYEERERERREREMEWRKTMEEIENEKIMMDQRWREREEERRVREEVRAEKRDALITALLNKISRDHI